MTARQSGVEQPDPSMIATLREANLIADPEAARFERLEARCLGIGNEIRLLQGGDHGRIRLLDARLARGHGVLRGFAGRVTDRMESSEPGEVQPSFRIAPIGDNACGARGAAAVEPARWLG